MLCQDCHQNKPEMQTSRCITTVDPLHSDSWLTVEPAESAKCHAATFTAV